MMVVQKFVQSPTLAGGSVTTGGRQRETALVANAIQCDHLFSRLYSHPFPRTALFRALCLFCYLGSCSDNNLTLLNVFKASVGLYSLCNGVFLGPYVTVQLAGLL